jgi:hypothetical protein
VGQLPLISLPRSALVVLRKLKVVDLAVSHLRSAHSVWSWEATEQTANPTGARRSRPRWSRTGYSITRSACASMDGGIVSPNTLAVLRFIASSNLVGCSTGRSAGFAPLSSLSTKYAARR